MLYGGDGRLLIKVATFYLTYQRIAGPIQCVDQLIEKFNLSCTANAGMLAEARSEGFAFRVIKVYLFWISADVSNNTNQLSISTCCSSCRATFSDRYGEFVAGFRTHMAQRSSRNILQNDTPGGTRCHRPVHLYPKLRVRVRWLACPCSISSIQSWVGQRKLYLLLRTMCLKSFIISETW